MLCASSQVLPISSVRRVLPHSHREKSCFCGQAWSTKGPVKRHHALHRAIFSAAQRQGSAATLPQIDWTRYHLQVLFVDRTDTVRARVATGLFERIAEWNGYGRALYPWACGVHASEAKPADFSTTVSLFSQASFLGIRKKLFAAPAEQLTLEDLDRYDVVVALDNDIKRDIIKMVQPEWHSYYDARVCMLDQFSDYLGSDILKTGGTAVLESELSGIIKPVIQESKAIPDLLRPSLHKGAEEWNPMVQAMIISCAGLVQYLVDEYPSDLPHYDPQWRSNINIINAMQKAQTARHVKVRDD